MKFDEAYLYSRDIDWFCIIGGVFCHVASAGGLLPDVVNDREKLRDIQKRVFDMDYAIGNEEIGFNNEFLYQRFGNDIESREAYLSSFIQMSRKGFVSLDRTNVMDITDQTYHVVCYPRRIIELNLLDLPQTDGDISHNQLTNIHLLDFFK
jgi:hypothetical protein